MTSMIHACASQPIRALPLPMASGKIVVRDECADDVAARERLLDAAFGPARFLKTCEYLRAGRVPAAGFALVAERDERIVGTVRLWNIDAGGVPALLLGPIAVTQSLRMLGIGRRLMAEALFRAMCGGHRAVLLVGDLPYYERFGFGRSATRNLSLPGPVEEDRFLGLELLPGALDGAHGLVAPTGRRSEVPRRPQPALAVAA